MKMKSIMAGSKHIYFNSDSAEKINYLMETTRLSISQVIQLAIEFMYNKTITIDKEGKNDKETNE